MSFLKGVVKMYLRSSDSVSSGTSVRALTAWCKFGIVYSK